MPIVVRLDVMLARRKITLKDLSERIGITVTNLSILNSGKAEAIHISTLQKICDTLACQPGDILENLSEEEYKKLMRK